MVPFGPVSTKADQMSSLGRSKRLLPQNHKNPMPFSQLSCCSSLSSCGMKTFSTIGSYLAAFLRSFNASTLRPSWLSTLHHGQPSTLGVWKNLQKRRHALCITLFNEHQCSKISSQSRRQFRIASVS